MNADSDFLHIDDDFDFDIVLLNKTYDSFQSLRASNNARTVIPYRFVNVRIDTRIQRINGKFAHLMRLLNDDSRKWEEITFEGDEDGDTMSQAFLSVLGLAMIKFEELCLKTWYSDEAFYRCLMSGLVSPLRVLSLDLRAYGPDRRRMRAAHWNHIAEGLAQTTALQSFSFRSEVDTSGHQDAPLEDISEVLVDGIARNTTIRHLKLQSGNLTDDNLFPRLMKSLQRYPKKLESLMLSSRKITTDHLKDLAGYLGHEKCSLKRFEICSSELSKFPPDFCNMKNVSVKTFHLSVADGWNEFVSSVCPKLSCLSSLTLDGTNLMDLSPLDVLLCDETALPSLTDLSLDFSGSNEQALSLFASKLPRMKHLRNLHLTCSAFQDHSTSKLESFFKLAQKSKTLEMISCRGIDDHALEVDLLRVLNLNKAGRRGIEIMSSGSRPLGIKLWPLILKRCLTVKYVKSMKRFCAEAKLDDQIARDNLFLILRDHACIFHEIQQVALRRNPRRKARDKKQF
ncbi:unnamed protein product [Cylindrotheca closterium]|uniref:Uncharacterized protein n=1 Tax=Cylindrotheca closterium TaxID=2856 RepID=A0AAD2FSQ2_9STRA|nr:unnamed protein product [Cylindrotheca closterium]